MVIYSIIKNQQKGNRQFLHYATASQKKKINSKLQQVNGVQATIS